MASIGVLALFRRETFPRSTVIKFGNWFQEFGRGDIPSVFISRARVTMRIRLIALAGVAALALSTPAMAAQGWYLGLGAGWDQQNSLKFHSVPTPTNIQTIKSKDGALI